MKRACHHLCPKFQAAMDVIAKPWNGLIIATLEGGALRFGELGARLQAIGDRMLSCRLKELEAQGLVERRVLPGPPVRVEYELTEVGRGFRPVAEAIGRWGQLLTIDEPTAAGGVDGEPCVSEAPAARAGPRRRPRS